MKPIKAKFIGIGMGDLALFNLLEPMLSVGPDGMAMLRNVGSTLTEQTINAAGYYVPFPSVELDAARRRGVSEELSYILSGVKSVN